MYLSQLINEDRRNLRNSSLWKHTKGGGGAGDIIIHPYLRIQTLHHLETPFQQFDPFQG